MGWRDDRVESKGSVVVPSVVTSHLSQNTEGCQCEVAAESGTANGHPNPNNTLKDGGTSVRMGWRAIGLVPPVVIPTLKDGGTSARQRETAAAGFTGARGTIGVVPPLAP